MYFNHRKPLRATNKIDQSEPLRFNVFFFVFTRQRLSHSQYSQPQQNRAKSRFVWTVFFTFYLPSLISICGRNNRRMSIVYRYNFHDAS